MHLFQPQTVLHPSLVQWLKHKGLPETYALEIWTEAIQERPRRNKVLAGQRKCGRGLPENTFSAAGIFYAPLVK